MDNYNGFPATYQPNWYYQPTQTTPIVYPQRNWNTTAVPQYGQNQTMNNTNIIWV